ncbi:MAG: aspartate aminotransferase family protein [Bacteroidia bacterium]
MDTVLKRDLAHWEDLLKETLSAALNYLAELDQHPAGLYYQQAHFAPLPNHGGGGRAALHSFQTQYQAQLSGSSGSRYLGYVTGGTTPAALMGDWLTSVFDQNVASAGDSAANEVEYEAIHMLRELFGLADEFSGTFVSGATMSSFVGLAIARQWWGQQSGRDIALDGFAERPLVFSGKAHSSIFKVLSMLGIGRSALQSIPCLPDREAIDISVLAQQLKNLNGKACIVVANAGTVNTVDYDDFVAIAKLKEQYPFWLHIDAAFGGFAACSPDYEHLVQGWNAADSISIDFHKMLNVPYDAAIQLSKHTQLQKEVFQNSGARYLEVEAEQIPFVHLTPENSRRFRALPTWFSLKAYGKAGYREIVERNARLARSLGEWLDQQTAFEVLAPVRFNVVCFKLKQEQEVSAFLKRLTLDGKVFLTPSAYQGKSCIRAAFSNWRTSAQDLAVIQQALLSALAPQN